MNTTLNKFVKRRKEFITSKIEEIGKELETLPPGKLQIAKRKDRPNPKFINKINGVKVYISSKQRDFARQLARRRYLEAQLADYQQELYAVELFLKHHKDSYDRADQVLNKYGFRELLEPYLLPAEVEAERWAKASYKQSTYKLEERTVKAADGKFYRSKSEAFIASELYKFGIPFRYEEATTLANGTIIHPDFKIRHNATGKIYVWEHLGMMNYPSYRKKNMYRLVDYSEIGYVLNDNLIVTTESDGTVLDVEEIDAIIQQHFL